MQVQENQRLMTRHQTTPCRRCRSPDAGEIGLCIVPHQRGRWAWFKLCPECRERFKRLICDFINERECDGQTSTGVGKAGTR